MRWQWHACKEGAHGEMGSCCVMLHTPAMKKLWNKNYSCLLCWTRTTDYKMGFLRAFYYRGGMAWLGWPISHFCEWSTMSMSMSAAAFNVSVNNDDDNKIPTLILLLNAGNSHNFQSNWGCILIANYFSDYIPVQTINLVLDLLCEVAGVYASILLIRGLQQVNKDD